MELRSELSVGADWMWRFKPILTPPLLLKYHFPTLSLSARYDITIDILLLHKNDQFQRILFSSISIKSRFCVPIVWGVRKVSDLIDQMLNDDVYNSKGVRAHGF